jgi:hypothetical protein
MHEKHELEPTSNAKTDDHQMSIEARATRNMIKRRQDEVTSKLLSDKENEHFIVPPTS